MIQYLKVIPMKSIRPQNIDKIKLSPELEAVEHLMPMSDSDRERLKADIEASGEIRDPLKVYVNAKDQVLILCGKNRFEIARELGWPTVPIEILTGLSKKQKQELVINDNLSRRQLTSEQKRVLAAYMLRLDPKSSNVIIAKKSGTTDKTVGKIRKQMEAGKKIRTVVKVLGQDKRFRKAKLAPRSKINLGISEVDLKSKNNPQKRKYNTDLIKHVKGTFKDIVSQTVKESPETIKAVLTIAAEFKEKLTLRLNKKKEV